MANAHPLNKFSISPKICYLILIYVTNSMDYYCYKAKTCLNYLAFTALEATKTLLEWIRFNTAIEWDVLRT